MKKPKLSARIKDTFRTIWRSKQRFLAIVAMTALGATVFVGLRSTSPNIRDTITDYVDDRQMYHLKVSGPMGLYPEDREIIENLNDLGEVEYRYREDVYMEDDTSVLRLYSLTQHMNLPQVVEGRLPEKKNEIALDAEARKDYKLGDILNVNEVHSEDELEEDDKQLNTNQFKITGFVRDAQYLTEQRGSTNKGNGKVLYFGIIPKEAFSKERPDMALIHLASLQDVKSFKDKYRDDELATIQDLKKDFSGRPDEIKAELTKDANQEIADGEQEVADARKEIADAEQKLKDARQELDDGWKEYHEGVDTYHQKISDAEQEIRDNEQKLKDSWQELEDGKKKLADGEKKYQDGAQEVADSEKKLADAKVQLEDGERQLQEGQKKLQDGQAELDKNSAQLQDGLRQIEEGQKTLLQKKAEVEQQKKDLLAQREDLLKQKAQLEEKREDVLKQKGEVLEKKKELETQKAQLEAKREELQAKKQEVLKKKQEVEGQKKALLAKKEELQAKKQELLEQKETLTQKRAELLAKRDQLKTQKEQVQAGLTQVEQGLAKTEEPWNTILQKEEELQGQKTKLLKGMDQLKEQIAALKEQIKGLPEGDPQIPLLQATLEKLQTQLGQLQAQLDQLNAGLEELQTKKAALQQKREQLQQKKAELEENLTQIEGGLAQIEENLPKIDAGLKAIEQNLPKIDAGLKQVEEGLTQVEAGLKEIEENLPKLEAGLKKLNEGLQQIEGGLKQIEENLPKLEAGLTQINDGLAQMKEGLAKMDKGLTQLDEGLATIASKYEETEQKKKELLNAKVQLEEGAKTLKENRAEWERQKKTFDSKKQEYQDGLKKLEDGKATLAQSKQDLDQARATIAENEQKLRNGEKELQEGRETLESERKKGLDELNEAQDKLLDGEEELKENQDKFHTEKQDADKEIADAEKEIADAKDEVAKLKIPNYNVAGRYDDFAINTYYGEADSLDSMSYIFPTIFYFIALLVSLTTMTRMVEEERTQIGTLKALGYSHIDIASKYLIYAALSSTIGTLIGILLGVYMLMPIVYNAYMAQAFCKKVHYFFDPVLSLTALGLSLLSTMIATWVTAKRTLKEVTSQLLRPKPPKMGKRVFLERIKPVWNHLSFMRKVTIRNIGRNKGRMWMTIIGVAGCVGLITMGFGISTSINGLFDKQFQQIYHYDLEVHYNPNASEKKLNKLRDLMDDSDFAATASLELQQGYFYGKDRVSENLVIVTTRDPKELENLVTLEDPKTEEPLDLKDGPIISRQIARDFNLKKGDVVQFYDADDIEHTITIAGVTQHFLGHRLYMSDKDYQDIFGKEMEENAYYIDLKDGVDGEAWAERFLKEDAVVSAMDLSQQEFFLDDLIDALNWVVLVIIAISSLLAFVVLYNLSNLNVSERLRELSTIKVLGFYSSEVTQYIYRESLYLTLIGIFFGFFAGKVMHLMIVTALSPNGVLLDPALETWSYFVSTGITLFFSLVVMWLIHKKLKKVDMVEALKAVE